MPNAHPTPILSLPTDSFTPALARLDPANRALLDLSLRRGMRPEEIGDLLGTDPESVIVAREAALEQLGAELGLDVAPDLDELRARLTTLPGEAWTPAAEGGPPPSRGGAGGGARGARSPAASGGARRARAGGRRAAAVARSPQPPSPD